LYDDEKTDANQPCELKGTGCSRRTQYDARGNPRSFTYDSAGARTRLIDPLHSRTTLAFDATGQQNFRIDARSNRASFVFNIRGYGFQCVLTVTFWKIRTTQIMMSEYFGQTH